MMETVVIHFVLMLALCAMIGVAVALFYLTRFVTSIASKIAGYFGIAILLYGMYLLVVYTAPLIRYD